MKPTTEHELVTIRTLVDAIVNILDCSQKSLCSLIGITPTALSISIDKSFADVKSNKVTKRLTSLLYVVETLKRDQSLNSSLIMKVLTTPCHRHDDGTFVDVVTAIHGEMQGKDNAFLVTIADAALKMLRKKYESNKWPIENGIYKKISALQNIG